MGNLATTSTNDKPFIKINLNCTCIKGSENEINDHLDGKEKEEFSSLNKKEKLDGKEKEEFSSLNKKEKNGEKKK